jgi:hypothetical protein
MRIFGVSLWTIVILGLAAYLGAKNPSWYTKVPGLNRL